MGAYNVLVVEDDQETLDEVVGLLEKEGYDVSPALTGTEGLAIVESGKPDIVITDIRLPGLSGLQLLEAIRAKSNGMPVILVTAFSETDTALQAIRLGALDYLKKPIEIDDLLVALGRAKEKVSKQKQFDEFPTLLLAEDDEASRQNLACALRKEGYTVIEARNGAEAVSAFRETKVDVVLLDIKMPRKDGLSAFAEMRAESDDFEAIILTGWGDEAAAIQALRLGAYGFTKKPIDLDEMLLSIEKAVAKRSADRSLRYRLREVELAHQIIAQLVANDDIALRVSAQVLDNACSKAGSLLDVFPDGIFILDDQLGIVFANKAVVQRCGELPVLLNSRLTAAVADGDERLGDQVRRAFDAPVGTLCTFEAGGHRITTTTAAIVRDGRSRRFAVVICVNADARN